MRGQASGKRKKDDMLGSSRNWKLDFSAGHSVSSAAASSSLPSQTIPMTASVASVMDQSMSTRSSSSHQSCSTRSTHSTGLSWGHMQFENPPSSRTQHTPAASNHIWGPPPTPTPPAPIQRPAASSLWGAPVDTTPQVSHSQQLRPPRPDTIMTGDHTTVVSSINMSEPSLFASSAMRVDPPPQDPWQNYSDRKVKVEPSPDMAPPAPPTRPHFPFKTSDVPKSALHSLYGKAPRRKPLSGNDYFTWHNAGPPHDLRWTSLFVCPLTAEIFATRPYEADPDFKREGGFVWYKKKTSAEHGAAANAFDCLTYRDFSSVVPDVAPFKMLLAQGELAYGPDRGVHHPPAGISTDILQRLEEKRGKIGHSSPPNEFAWQKRPGEGGMF